MSGGDKYAAGDPLPLKGSPYEHLPRANKQRLLEPHPIDGPDYLVGRDPRGAISREDFASCGHTRSILEAVRAKCLDCCCQQPNEVRYCTATFCALWPFRMSANPFHKRELSEARREELRERGRAAAARKHAALAGDHTVGLPEASDTQDGPLCQGMTPRGSHDQRRHSRQAGAPGRARG
jgi:hypothetical protein